MPLALLLVLSLGGFVLRSHSRAQATSGRSVGHVSAQERAATFTFDPGVLGTSAATGHVTYVEAVGDDGTFTISEMNAPLPWQVTYRTIRTAAVAQGGISFVY